MLDISHTLVAKSDQLNSDDLITGPVTVQITGVTVRESSEQPVDVHLTGGFRPWRPCKTMRRVLSHGWGNDAEQWKGRWLVLYREAAVKFGGDEVGGIRVRAMSHIDHAIKVNLNSSRGKKQMHHVEIFVPTNGGTKQDRAATLSRWCNDAVKSRGWTVDEIKALLGNRPAKDVPDGEHEELIARLKGPPPPTSAPTDEAAQFDREVPPDEDYGQPQDGEDA